MDPITQGLLGAAAGQGIGSMGRVPPALRRASWMIGAGGGVLPDVDSLISSASDPLLAIEYHRHFTHALAFIPVGGLVAALPWLLGRRFRGRAGWVYLVATAGYATHGLLDAFTTYGTQLFWPFARTRIAWNWISIIDPVFTLALLVGVVLAARRVSPRPALAALLFCAAYLGLGRVQHARALAVQERVAAARGHVINRGEAFPTLGNNLVWRSLYQAGDSLYADRVRVPWFGAPRWSAGSTVALLRNDALQPALLARERVRRDLDRFRWFADGWLARAPADPSVIGDVRYSLRTDAFDPIWGIRFDATDPEYPTVWVNRTAERELALRSLWREITGQSPDYRLVPAEPASVGIGARITLARGCGTRTSTGFGVRGAANHAPYR